MLTGFEAEPIYAISIASIDADGCLIGRLNPSPMISALACRAPGEACLFGDHIGQRFRLIGTPHMPDLREAILFLGLNGYIPADLYAPFTTRSRLDCSTGCTAVSCQMGHQLKALLYLPLCRVEQYWPFACRLVKM